VKYAWGLGSHLWSRNGDDDGVYIYIYIYIYQLSDETDELGIQSASKLCEYSSTVNTIIYRVSFWKQYPTRLLSNSLISNLQQYSQLVPNSGDIDVEILYCSKRGEVFNI
jgi:hypothetical protein